MTAHRGVPPIRSGPRRSRLAGGPASGVGPRTELWRWTPTRRPPALPRQRVAPAKLGASRRGTHPAAAALAGAVVGPLSIAIRQSTLPVSGTDPALERP